MASNKRGAKRKPELDLEVERSAYASFVAAANAVSALYTAGVREQRRAAKATLEKALAFVLRESPNSEFISKAALIQWLQQEYEVRRRSTSRACARMPAPHAPHAAPRRAPSTSAAPRVPCIRSRHAPPSLLCACSPLLASHPRSTGPLRPFCSAPTTLMR
jgi:hypothetical protein